MAETQPSIKTCRIILVVICVLAIAVSAFFFTQKSDYHNDEYTSFVIANNSANTGMFMDVQTNYYYGNIDEPYSASMTVHDNRFDIAQVLYNDSFDTLPPLHYILLNFAFSFFPGTFSKWYGASINIVFLILCVIILFEMMIALGAGRIEALLACVVLAVMPGILEIVLFIRMYTMSMFWVLLLSFCSIKVLQANRVSLGPLVGVVLALAGGALTHYYFLVFAFLQYCYLLIVLGAYRRWRTVIVCIVAALVAAAVAVVLFPNMLDQVFASRLQSDGVDKLVGSDFLGRCAWFVSVIDGHVLGGFLPLVVICAVFVAVVEGMRRVKGNDSIVTRVGLVEWGALALPAILYFIVMSKMAFFETTRYMCFIYPLVIALAIHVLHVALSVIPNKMFSQVAAVLLVAALVVLGHMNCPYEAWEYNSLNMLRAQGAVAQYADCDVVCLYEKVYRAEDTWMFNKPFNGVIFTTADELSGLSSALPSDAGSFVLELDSSLDADIILSKIIDELPQIERADQLAEIPYFNVYLLH